MTEFNEAPEEVKLPMPKKAKAKDTDQPKKPKPLVHEHPNVGPHRSVIWFPACRLCQKEDQERRLLAEPQIAEDELDFTVFLYPDYAPEANVCNAYVRQQYPGARLMGSTLNLERVANTPGAQIVCVRRVALPGQKLTSHFERVLDDQTNKYKEVERDDLVNALMPEVLESKPIQIVDCVQIQAASLLRESQFTAAELVERLADNFFGYRVQAPIHPDTTLKVTWA